MFFTVLLSTYLFLFSFFGLFAVEGKKRSLTMNFLGSNLLLVAYSLFVFVLFGLLLINNPSIIYTIIAGYDLYSVGHFFIIIPLLVLFNGYFMYVYGKRYGYFKTFIYITVIKFEAIVLALLFALVTMLYYPLWFLLQPLMTLVIVTIFVHAAFLKKSQPKKETSEEVLEGKFTEVKEDSDISNEGKKEE